MILSGKQPDHAAETEFIAAFPHHVGRGPLDDKVDFYLCVAVHRELLTGPAVRPDAAFKAGRQLKDLFHHKIC